MRSRLSFAPGAKWGLFEHEHMERELAALLGRPVDLVSRRAIESSENALRRSAILTSAVPQPPRRPQVGCHYQF
ncbi:MAG: hypothetical protein JNN08_21420 [Bryobacterales bacterium]|nr:hypothetical protein [Bryobacterales bacterium]